MSPDESEDIERQFDAAALAQSLETALESMPPRSREILRLRIVEQLSNREVAETLCISENAARVRLSRSLKSLRNKLNNAKAFST